LAALYGCIVNNTKSKKEQKMHPVGTMTWRSDLKVLIVLALLAPVIWLNGYQSAQNKAMKIVTKKQEIRNEIKVRHLTDLPYNRDDRLVWLRDSIH